MHKDQGCTVIIVEKRMIGDYRRSGSEGNPHKGRRYESESETITNSKPHRELLNVG